MHATFHPTQAHIRLCKEVLGGILHVSNSLHAAIKEIIIDATPIHDPNVQTSCVCVEGATPKRIQYANPFFATMRIVQEAYTLTREKGKSINREWNYASIPYELICAAGTYLLSSNLPTFIIDVFTLNGADKDDLYATLPFISPFHLLESADVDDDELVHRITHILTVVYILQQYPHAYEISLSTWVYISSMLMNGDSIESFMMGSNYFKDVINAMLTFEPLDVFTPIAKRVIASMLRPETLHPNAAFAPCDVLYGKSTILTRAIERGELAYCALLRHINDAILTLVFYRIEITADDIRASWAYFIEQCKKYKIETQKMEKTPLCFEMMDGFVYWSMREFEYTMYTTLMPLFQTKTWVQPWAPSANELWTQHESRHLILTCMMWYIKGEECDVRSEEWLIPKHPNEYEAFLTQFEQKPKMRSKVKSDSFFTWLDGTIDDGLTKLVFCMRMKKYPLTTYSYFLNALEIYPQCCL
jgi:hypothetical protein